MKVIEGGSFGGPWLAQQVIDRCYELALLSKATEEAQETSASPFLSPTMKALHRQITSWMETLGMAVHADPAGNLHGAYPANAPSAPRLLIGSHIDAAPDAGTFNGTLGVVLGISLIEALAGEKLPFSIEVVAFNEEASNRFDIPFLGSRAFTGNLDTSLLSRKDANCIGLDQAVRASGPDPLQLLDQTLSPSIFAYLEFHPEQGPILNQLGVSLGVVDTIVGQSRLRCTFRGKADHAGTTPMFLRKDALVAAAEWITLIEKAARNAVGMVATVGELDVSPGRADAIPGEVRLILDLRHAKDSYRHAALEALLSEARRIAVQRDVLFDYSIASDQRAMSMSRSFSRQVETALVKEGLAVLPVTSGVGHDAMVLADKIPSAMLLLRSSRDTSAPQEETVLLQDVQAALKAGLRLLRSLRLDEIKKEQ